MKTPLGGARLSQLSKDVNEAWCSAPGSQHSRIEKVEIIFKDRVDYDSAKRTRSGEDWWESGESQLQPVPNGITTGVGSFEIMEVHYLNTDLEIESVRDLSRVVEEFGEDVIVLHHGESRGYDQASFEIASGADLGADEVINYFCSLVEGLPKEVREIWDGCCSRILDVGYESGTTPHNFRSEIRASTIQRVAGIGASIVITVYSIPVS